MINVIAALALLLLAPTQVNAAENGGTCSAGTLVQMNNCINANANIVELTQNITCTSGDCTIRIFDKECITIDGNGHTLTRKTADEDSPTLLVQRSNDIRVTNLKIVDSTGFDPTINLYVRSVFVYDSTNVFFDAFHVDKGRSYAFVVQKTTNFTLQNSRITNANVVGLYIGYRGNATDITKNITLTNNIFANIGSNGIAVHGLEGTNNLIDGNYFFKNHWFNKFSMGGGKFYQAGGRFYGGGQAYIADAANLIFSNNEIRHGHCINCGDDPSKDLSVHGVELGELNQKSLSNVLITKNLIIDNRNCGVLLNPSSIIDSTVVVVENTFRSNRCHISTNLSDNAYDNIFLD